MSEKPILVKTELIPLILIDIKTQTRRTGGLEIVNRSPDSWKHTGIAKSNRALMWFEFIHSPSTLPMYMKPKYQIGDCLWVRETWMDATYSNDGSRPQEKFVFYKADIDGDEDKYFYEWSNTFGKFPPRKWKPSIFMPKKYARIWLEVTNVKVERLQNISNDDAIAEGFNGVRCDHPAIENCGGVMACTDCYNTGWIEPPIVDFVYLWDSINKKRGYGWDVNPWVFVYEFRRHYESMGGIE